MTLMSHFKTAKATGIMKVVIALAAGTGKVPFSKGQAGVVEYDKRTYRSCGQEQRVNEPAKY